MKAEELMIGDWVLYQGKPTLVERLTNEGIINVPEKWIDASDKIEPVPLTPEILEKNGFKVVHGFGFSDFYPTWGFAWNKDLHHFGSIDITFYDKKPFNGVNHLVEIQKNSFSGDGINSIHSCDIDYIHQLQHALRLCGISKEIIL